MSDDYEKPHTVAELIAKLQTLPPEATVTHEGCDCTGNWNGEVEVYEPSVGSPTGEILIGRYK